jgi:hypothetical protein
MGEFASGASRPFDPLRTFGPAKAERTLCRSRRSFHGGWMLVTAKLSREFYEKFGHKIADEFAN